MNERDSSQSVRRISLQPQMALCCAVRIAEQTNPGEDLPAWKLWRVPSSKTRPALKVGEKFLRTTMPIWRRKAAKVWHFCYERLDRSCCELF